MATYNVANAAALQTALSRAVGGDRIVLAAGDYGDVVISNRNYASNVTIMSAGARGSAHMDGLFVQNSSNITFQYLDLGRALNAGESIYTQLNWVRNSTNIRMLAVDIHGSEDGDYSNDGQGLIASGTTNFRIESSNISDVTRGVYVERGTNTTVANNIFDHIRMDGLAVASQKAIFITGNVFSHFQPVGNDHGDAIQFWNTNQTSGTQNVLIKDNIIWMPEEQPEGTGSPQGIFIADPYAYGYQNVQIRNNLIYSNDVWNGLTVVGARNLQIANNTVVSREGDAERQWIRLENSTLVSVQNNVSEGMVLNNTSPVLLNNYDLFRTPALRALFADLDSPGSILDLLLPGIGYQAPAGRIPTLTAEGGDPERPLVPDFDNKEPITSAVFDLVAADDLLVADLPAPQFVKALDDWFVALA